MFRSLPFRQTPTGCSLNEAQEEVPDLGGEGKEWAVEIPLGCDIRSSVGVGQRRRGQWAPYSDLKLPCAPEEDFQALGMDSIEIWRGATEALLDDDLQVYETSRSLPTQLVCLRVNPIPGTSVA